MRPDAFLPRSPWRFLNGASGTVVLDGLYHTSDGDVLHKVLFDRMPGRPMDIYRSCLIPFPNGLERAREKLK